MPDLVKQILADALHIDVTQIRFDSRLREDLGIDSLTVLECVLKVERTFDIVIEDADLVSLRSVSDVCGIVDRKLRNKG